MGKKENRPPRKRKKTARRKNTSWRRNLKRSAVGLAILLLFIVSGGLLAHHLLDRKQPPPHSPGMKKAAVQKPEAHKIPPFEIYPEKIPPAAPISRPKTPRPKDLPKVAIIIDDIGHDIHMAEKFLQLNAVFTFSVLPHSPQLEEIAELIHVKGLETMLHLPMEPDEYPLVDPGPGALLTSMSPDELINQLNKNLAAVPFVKGVNNHMGSKMTTVSTQMYQIFSILKKRHLFFIDSRTTAESLCRPSARLLKVMFGQRDVFLDHIQEPEAIRKQIKRLVRTACRQGEAIGIAHPHPVTYRVLRRALPDLQEKVRLVPASAVVHTFG